MIVRPLEAMLTNYNRTRKLEWTQNSIAAFEEIKQAIHNCQALTFLYDDAEVHLKIARRFDSRFCPQLPQNCKILKILRFLQAFQFSPKIK